MKKAILQFIKNNTLIFVFFIISIGIIFLYIFTMDWAELFKGVELWFNLMFQLSVGYIINFMFYVTQVYIPNNKRDIVVKQQISIRLKEIISNMRQSISALSNVYVKDHIGDDYTNEELSLLLNLRFSDHVNVLNASKTTRDQFVYFTVREWIAECIHRTENEIDKLYKYYSADISAELMKVLEDVLHSMYHSMMKTLLSTPNDVDFSQCNDNFFVPYYELICKLEKIDKREYSFSMKNKI